MFWLLARRPKTFSTFQLQVRTEPGRKNSRTAPRLTPRLANELFPTITVMLSIQPVMAFPIFSLFFPGPAVWHDCVRLQSAVRVSALSGSAAQDWCSWSLLGSGLGISFPGWWLITWYIPHFVYSSAVIIVVVYIFLRCSLKLVLPRPTSFTLFFPILSPIPSGKGGVTKWLCGSSCWLGLNHDTQLNSFTAAKPLCLTSHTVFL